MPPLKDLKAALSSENFNLENFLDLLQEKVEAYIELENAAKSNEKLIDSLDDAKFDDELIQLLIERFGNVPSLNKELLLDKWMPALTLLDKSPNTNRLLQLTAQWIIPQQLDATDIKKISDSLRLLDKEASLETGIGEIAQKLARSAMHNLRSLGFSRSPNISPEDEQKALVSAIQSSEQITRRHLIYPHTIAKLTQAMKSLPSNTSKGNLLGALKLHAEGLLISLGDDPTKSPQDNFATLRPDLISERQIRPIALQNILEGMKDVPNFGGVLPILLRHINLPSNAYNNLDHHAIGAPFEVFAAEILNSLRGHFDDPSAYELIKSLYKKSNRDVPPLDTLKDTENLNAYIFNLLQNNENFIRKEEGVIKIDCHGLTHSLAKTFMKQALESVAADEFDGPLHLIYGWGKHNPSARGKMREVVEKVFREMGIEGVVFNKGHAETNALDLWHKLATSDTLSSQVALKIVISAEKHNEHFDNWKKQFQKSLIADLSRLDIENFDLYLDAIIRATNTLSYSTKNKPELKDGLNKGWNNASDHYLSKLLPEVNSHPNKIRLWIKAIDQFSASNKPEILKGIVSSIAERFASLTADELQQLAIKPGQLAKLASYFNQHISEPHCLEALKKLAENVCHQYAKFSISTNATDAKYLYQVHQIFLTQTLTPESIFTKASNILQQTNNIVTALDQWEASYTELKHGNQFTSIFHISPRLSSYLMQIATNDIVLTDELSAMMDEIRLAVRKADVVLCPLYPLDLDTSREAPTNTVPRLLVFDFSREMNAASCYQFSPIDNIQEHFLAVEPIKSFFKNYLSNKSLNQISNLSLPTRHNSSASDSVLEVSNVIFAGFTDASQSYKPKTIYSGDLQPSLDKSFNENDYSIFSLALIQAIESNNKKAAAALIKEARERNQVTHGYIADRLCGLPRWQALLDKKQREEIDLHTEDPLPKKLQAVLSNPPIDTFKTAPGGIENYLKAVKSYVDGMQRIKKEQEAYKVFLTTGQTGDTKIGFDKFIDSLPETSRALFEGFLNGALQSNAQKELEQEWEKTTASWTEPEYLFYTTLRDKCIELGEDAPSSREHIKRLKAPITASLKLDKTIKLLNDIDAPSRTPSPKPVKKATEPIKLSAKNKTPDRQRSFETKEQALLTYMNEPDADNRFKLLPSLRPYFNADMDLENEIQSLLKTIQPQDIKDQQFDSQYKKTQEELKVIKANLNLNLVDMSVNALAQYSIIIDTCISGRLALEDVFDGNEWAKAYQKPPFDKKDAVKVKSLIQVCDAFQFESEYMELSSSFHKLDFATRKFKDFSTQMLSEKLTEYVSDTLEEISSGLLFQQSRDKWLNAQWDQERLLIDRDALITGLSEHISDNERTIVKIIEESISQLRNVKNPTHYQNSVEDKSLWEDRLPSSLSEQDVKCLKSIRDFYLRRPDQELAQNLSKMHEQALEECKDELKLKGWTPEEEAERDSEMLDILGATARSGKNQTINRITSTFAMINRDHQASYLCSPNETAQAVYILAHQEEKVLPEIRESRQMFLDNLATTARFPQTHSLALFPINLNALEEASENNNGSIERWALIVIDAREAQSPYSFCFTFDQDSNNSLPIQKVAQGLYELMSDNGVTLPAIQVENIALNDEQTISNALISTTQSLIDNFDAEEQLLPISNKRAQRKLQVDTWLPIIKKSLDADHNQDNASLIEAALLGNSESKESIMLDLFPTTWTETLFNKIAGDPSLQEGKAIGQYAFKHLANNKTLPMNIKVYSTFAKKKDDDGKPDKVSVDKANNFWNSMVSKPDEKNERLKKFFETLKKMIDKQNDVWAPENMDEVFNEYEADPVRSLLTSKTVTILTNVFPQQAIIFLDTLAQLQKTKSKEERPLLLAKMIASKPSVDNEALVDLIKKLPEEENKVNELNRIATASKTDKDLFAKKFLDSIDAEARQVLPATQTKYQDLLESLQQPFSIKALQKSDDLIETIRKSFEMDEETKKLPMNEREVAHRIKLEVAIERFGLSSAENNTLLGLRDYMLSHHHEKIIYGQTIEDVRKTVLKQLQKDLALIQKATTRLNPSLEQTINDLITPSREQNEILKAKELKLAPVPNSGGGWGVVPLQYENREITTEHFNTPRKTRVMLIARKKGDNTYTAHLLSEDRLGKSLFEKLQKIVDEFGNSVKPLESRDNTPILLRTLSQSGGSRGNTTDLEIEPSSQQKRPRSKSVPG